MTCVRAREESHYEQDLREFMSLLIYHVFKPVEEGEIE